MDGINKGIIHTDTKRDSKSTTETDVAAFIKETAPAFK
jgi:hypothetical protein